MKKRDKIIIGLVLSFIAICFIIAMPWLLVVFLFVGAFILGIRKGAKEDRLKKQTPTPLSAIVNNDLRIMKESLNLVNTSSNLQTVIYRYDDLAAVLKRLSIYERNPAVSFSGEQPSEALARITSEKAEIMNYAIQRAYDSVLHKCAALKTEKGRKNRQMKFFDELNSLMEHFPEETRTFVVDFVNENINDPLDHLEGL